MNPGPTTGILHSPTKRRQPMLVAVADMILEWT